MSLAQLAKVDLYADHVFVVAQAAELGAFELEYTDVSIFLSEKRVISVCRLETAFGQRLRNRTGKLAQRKANGPEHAGYKHVDMKIDGHCHLLQTHPAQA